MNGLADTLHDLVRNLRGDDDVVKHLSERRAVFPGHPADHRGYPVSVVVTPIYAGTTLHRDVTTHDSRVQITVKATRPWRESKEPNPGALAAMYEIMDSVGNRLERAEGLDEIPLGGEGGPEPQPMEDGRLAVTSDWRLRGIRTYPGDDPQPDPEDDE